MADTLRARNNLNIVRLALAGAVLYSHLFPLLLEQPDPGVGPFSYGGIAVLGFFGISGLLITESFQRRPELLSFTLKRACRLLPAYWVCLVVTAVAFVPIILSQQETAAGKDVVDIVSYPIRNAFLYVSQGDVNGVLTDVPVQGTLNGSAWTLFFEAVCYAAVAVIGALGLLGFVWIRVGCVVVLAATYAVITDNPSLNINADSQYSLAAFTSLGTAFAVGAVLASFMTGLRLHLPAGIVAGTGALVALSATTGVVRATIMPMICLALLYGLLCLGLCLRPVAWFTRNDLSYGVYLYAFPVTQVAASADIDAALAISLTLLVTVAIAAASWFLVESPALRFASARAGGGLTNSPTRRA